MAPLVDAGGRRRGRAGRRTARSGRPLERSCATTPVYDGPALGAGCSACGPRDRRAREHDDRRPRRLRAARSTASAPSCSTPASADASGSAASPERGVPTAMTSLRRRRRRRDRARHRGEPGAGGLPGRGLRHRSREAAAAAGVAGRGRPRRRALAGQARRRAALPCPTRRRSWTRSRAGSSRDCAAGIVVLIVTSTVSPETPVELDGARLARRRRARRARQRRPRQGRAPASSRSWSAAPRPSSSAAARVLEALGGHVVHVGPDSATARSRSSSNNLMGAVIVVGIAEGLALAAKAGADVAAVCEAIAGGSGSSWILREWIPETVFARRLRAPLLARPDAEGHGPDRARSQARSACRRRRSTSPLRAFERAVAEGYGGSDFSRASLALSGARPPEPSVLLPTCSMKIA